MHMFYGVMKAIHQFAANLLSYIPTKYYWNRSTSDLVIAKSKRVNFFLKHSVVSEILGGPIFKLGGAVPPLYAPSRNFFVP